MTDAALLKKPTPSGEAITVTTTAVGTNDLLPEELLPETSTPPPPPPPERPHTYDLKVNKDQNDRAIEIRLWSAKRPHMRAFHSAWLAFFIAFFMWFSISPLLSVVQDSLGLDRGDIWLSTVCSDFSTIVARFIVGWACDSYGARLPMGVVLVLAALPTALTGAIHSLAGLCIVRFCIGIAGSSFVMAQYWMGQFFVKEKIGTANAIVAGWGNAGGGFAQVVMGSLLFPLFRDYVIQGDDEQQKKEEAWRYIFVFPAIAALVIALLIVRTSDDAPNGYYKIMKLNGTMDIRHSSSTFMSTTSSRNAWLLAIAYACSFGVEISLNNAASLYFQDTFALSVEASAAAAATTGMTNLVARAIGGMVSDMAMGQRGMQGRLRWAALVIILQGAATIGFASADRTLLTSILLLALTSCLIHMTEGAIFGIVPYVNNATSVAGTIAGIVGLGGNVGGVIFALLFRSLSYRTTFTVMGVMAIASSVVHFGIYIRGHSTMTSTKTSLTTLNHEERRRQQEMELRRSTAVGIANSDAPSSNASTLPSVPEDIPI